MPKMYKTDIQISLAEFKSPFGELDHENRWIKIANMLPWQKYEIEYSKQFSKDNGAPAIKFRMAMGTLIIQQQTGQSDEEVLQDILENPYKQFLIGLHEFTKEPPFSARSITNFRKYIPAEMINDINNHLFRNVCGDNKNDNTDKNDDENNNAGTPPNESIGSNEAPETRLAQSPKKGTLLYDATCAPADISYPTDVNLLNEAREKLEGMIDTLQKYNDRKKPRTYRKKARREYLRFVLNKKPGYEKVRKAIKQQLGYVARDIRYIEELSKRIPICRLSSNQQSWLNTIQELYAQQLYMYKNNTHSVANRIVSIGQPHVRPIVRGKSGAPVEFGAKVSISLTEGYSFIDRLSWDAYNEDSDLIPAIEAYKKYNGYYPERVLADHLYRTKANRKYCKDRGIRLSGPPLGRPPKEIDKILLKQQIRDSSDRSPVEGKFGEGKTKYGLDRIMARIKESSETVISIAFLCMNINRRLRVLLRFFQWLLYFRKKIDSITILHVDNFFLCA
jgi:hypothetical protein